MKRVIVSGTLAMLIGLLIAVPLSAQATGPTMNKPLTQLQDIRMLVLVDRMNLSADQMKTLHTALTDVLNQAASLQTLATQFRQDLINFNGTNDQLNTLIEGYRTKLHDAMTALHDQAKTALDSVKSSLTIEQGELLREALMPQMGMMPGAAPRMGFMGMGNAPAQPPHPFGQRPMGQQFGNRPWGNNGQSQMKPMRPGMGMSGDHPLLFKGEELFQRMRLLDQIIQLKLKAIGS